TFAVVPYRRGEILFITIQSASSCSRFCLEFCVRQNGWQEAAFLCRNENPSHCNEVWSWCLPLQNAVRNKPRFLPLRLRSFTTHFPGAPFSSASEARSLSVRSKSPTRFRRAGFCCLFTAR